MWTIIFKVRDHLTKKKIKEKKVDDEIKALNRIKRKHSVKPADDESCTDTDKNENKAEDEVNFEEKHPKPE